MNTFVPFPKLETNVPRFLFERAMVVYIRKFVQWCSAEYVSAVEYYRQIGDARSARLVEKRFSPAVIASRTPEFKKIVALMTSEVWNSLSREERKLLNSAYSMAFI